MNGQNINATLLQNVEQPKLAKTLIKLREVYVDFMSEVDRAKEEYGVLVNDRIDDKFCQPVQRNEHVNQQHFGKDYGLRGQ